MNENEVASILLSILLDWHFWLTCVLSGVVMSAFELSLIFMERHKLWVISNALIMVVALIFLVPLFLFGNYPFDKPSLDVVGS
jgi:formate hydrogenlyase subunit 4